MLWEHDIEIIVMMTGLKENGRNKCEAYWPSQPGEVMEDEDFKVRPETFETRKSQCLVLFLHPLSSISSCSAHVDRQHRRRCLRAL